MEYDSWVPEGVDITVPNASRVYDYALGGMHNFAVDRAFWHQVQALFPDAHLIARANRAYLGRAVRWLVEEQGVDQFLDIGSGIPTLGNVHEVAQRADPRARVVYVDVDPIAVEQSRSLLRDNPKAQVIHGDLRDPDAVVWNDEVISFLDFSRPIAVLMVAVLHFIPDEVAPRALISRIGTALMPGSFLVLSHVGPEVSEQGLQRQETARRLYEKTPTPLVIRDGREFRALIDDSFEVLEPGIVAADRWRPDPEQIADIPPQPNALVAVARRR
ncbi:SAM-dependent methyltransferase [Actinoplanes sp. CA-252034]|uniref:SAM-dependent methyltransferase n=1 Tax=Actinoplanes sp. CA-252034 TaxID=3239906 RepID=UPI003D966119